MEGKLFSRGLVDEIRGKFEKEGLEKIHTNELLVLITDRLEGRLEAFDARLEAIIALARPLVAALWVIALGVIAGLISGLVVAIITLR